MKKKRIVFLLGAGSALSWGGPSTQELLELIKKNNVIKTAFGENVISYFVNLLNKSYDNPVNVNFETVISLLEVLYEYYDNKSISGNTPDLHPVWPNIFNIEDDIDKELFSHYQVKTHALADHIVEEDTVNILDRNNNMINTIPCAKSRWKVVVLHNIYSAIIETISNRILEYDDEILQPKDKLSSLLITFVTYLSKADYISRFYTTNYDKLIFTIFKDNESIIDGFDGIQDRILNATRVMSDFETLCYYNLHGSIYWEEYFSHKSMNIEFKSLNHPNYNAFGASRYTIDNAREALFTNILVGNNKTQKVSIPPLNYFESAFNQDCKLSDILFVIGSSLNDYDIRKSIFTALSNTEKILIIVTKIDSINIEKIKSVIKDISPIPERMFINKYKNSKEWWANKEQNCYVYINGFDKFLCTNAWEEVTF